MATITEGNYRGEGIVQSEEHSFESCTVLSGQNLSAMTVCGKVTIAGIGRVSVPTVVGTGNGTVSLVTAGPLAQVGNYVATCTTAATHGGTFTVVAPDGTTVGTVAMTGGTGATTAFKSPHINFSITDGSTDFALNDVFTFVVGTTVPAVVGTGDGVISALSLGADAQRGNYKITNIFTVTNGGYWQVQAPDGSVVAVQTVTAGAGGTAVITSTHINATITDGSTDFAKGDYFNVAVYGPAAGPKVVAWDATPTTFDGRQRVAGVILGAVDASSADTAGTLLVRNAVVHESKLKWLSGTETGDKTYAKQQLAALGIVPAVAA